MRDELFHWRANNLGLIGYWFSGGGAVVGADGTLGGAGVAVGCAAGGADRYP